MPMTPPPGMAAGTPPFNQEPGPPPQVAGRGILDLSTLPPELIQILISLGVLDQNGMPLGGQMDMMEPTPGPPDPRVDAIKRAIGAGAAQVPNGF